MDIRVLQIKLKRKYMYVDVSVNITAPYAEGLVLRAHLYTIEGMDVPASKLGRLELPALRSGKHSFQLRLLKPPAGTASISIGVVEPRVKWLCHVTIDV